MWEAIKTCNLGVDHVKQARLQTLFTEFENLKMSDNDTIDAYATKLSGIASKSTTLGEVMSEHKLVKKFLTSLPRRFGHVVAALEQVLDLKMTGFEDVVGQLKAYEERVKEKDQSNDAQENLLYVRTEYSSGNNDSSRGRGRGSYSRDRGRSRGQGSGRGNTQTHGQCDSSKNYEDNEQKEKHTPPKSESDPDEDDVWYFDNGASNHMTGKGLIKFQGKNEEQKLLKDVYYIPALRSNVISLEQATIFGYDISNRGDFLTMRDSCGDLLIKVMRRANRLYMTQLKVGKEDSNQASREPRILNVVWNDAHGDELEQQLNENTNLEQPTDESSARINLLHNSPIHASIQEHEDEDYGRDDTPTFTLKEIQCVQVKAVYRKVPNGEFIIVVVNVDDLFMIGTSLDLLNEFKKRMVSQFEMPNLGELTYYLGIEVSQENDCVEIKQERYAKKILKEADLTYSVGVVSRYMQSPIESHARVIKQILRYRKGTTLFGIEYKRGNDMRLIGYSSHNVDIDDGRSTTEHVFYLGTSAITWCLQKQTTMALSLCEAEFMVATAAVCQASWLRELLAEVTGMERQQVIIRVDNKLAIALSKNSVFHERSKHIHTRYHFIHEYVKNEQVIVEHVYRENQRANPLTNALARIRFKEMRLLLGVQELPSST
nr:hypothetical protein [Tanacetum cinerariifolium]